MLDNLRDDIKPLLHTIYFNNLFTNINLLTDSEQRGYGGSGTIRENRLPKSCNLLPKKELEKKGRGAFDYIRDENTGTGWIKFPTLDKKIATKQQFMANYRFTGCIGCIDCTHVSEIAPKDEEHNYLNRKGFHFKNVQLICNSNLKILAVNARHAGATHDAAI
ncbi:hypothetical protein ILUMI_18058 [Ignelater luminosus]|uniref:DDE Tnp4 domain-containing protein n=1 Tax=Ignelater luminosus TaxID=2038154 RepID=A0A8K0CR00_IGNLU|nr:hypothetical protein ILUMI_18058 [Ignelater luminosus]